MSQNLHLQSTNKHHVGRPPDLTETFLMARIKTMTRQSCMKLFVKLHDKHRALMKSKGRASDTGRKRSAFVLELDSLFNKGAPDAVQNIESNRLLSMEKKDEDIRLYQDQRTERKGLISGHDKIFETRSQQQLQQNKRQLFTWMRSSGVIPVTVTLTQRIWITSSLVLELLEHEDTVTLTFPRIVVDAICNTADRLGFSDNQVTALVSSTFKAGEADLDKFIISRSTIRRNRKLFSSQSYITEFSEDPPHLAALHWDGNMLRNVLGS
ncbi:hypothetical protein O3P69_014350 [Scylla paramamosain]|uniref:Uncharacterized protein n=1 Tax=Scylla paramamosain TaxID=85552 RepID=A0AAW0TBS7_SCYPA